MCLCNGFKMLVISKSSEINEFKWNSSLRERNVNSVITLLSDFTWIFGWCNCLNEVVRSGFGEERTT